MKPLDIDGNVLAIDNLVELAIELTICDDGSDIPPELAPGNIFNVQGFEEDNWFPGGIGALVGFNESEQRVWIATSRLRLIKPDQKSKTRIDFVVRELTK
jgi:hypothetical protein